LESVEVPFDEILTDGNLSATILSDSSGVPGDSLGTLTTPRQSGVRLTFIAPDAIILAASTTCWFVLDVCAGSASHGFLRTTLSGNEDSGGAAGWSIADTTIRLGSYLDGIGGGIDWTFLGAIVTKIHTSGSVSSSVIVLLARDGSGTVKEDDTVRFTVMLDRVLMSGEIVDVQLEIGGIGLTMDDWRLMPDDARALMPVSPSAIRLLGDARCMFFGHRCRDGNAGADGDP